MECREHCGACCIAPSISSPIPRMPRGKPGGIACIHLSEDFRCLIWDQPDRPSVCADFRAEPEICGTSREEALILLGKLEQGLP